MLRWMGVVLGVLTIVWVILQRDMISWSSLCAGVAVASALVVILYKAEKPLPPPTNEKLEWQMKLDEAQAQASQTIDGLNREVQKIEQKRIRTEERCLSYQKLVEVHQQEIEKLRHENQVVAEQLIQKERKLSELVLSKMEPDLFDTQRRHTETVNRELKKQLTEAKSELARKKKNVMPELESRDLLS